MNSTGAAIQVDALATDARRVYLQVRAGSIARAMLLDGMHLSFGRREDASSAGARRLATRPAIGRAKRSVGPPGNPALLPLAGSGGARPSRLYWQTDCRS